jgi:hypothetical protein
MRHEHISKCSHCGHSVKIAMGFDVPLQGYFMTVESTDENNPNADEETGMIYSNLDDPELKKTMGFSSDIELFKKRLREMQIEVPPEFFGKVLAD